MSFEFDGQRDKLANSKQASNESQKEKTLNIGVELITDVDRF